jgi:hypothetical protein
MDALAWVVGVLTATRATAPAAIKSALATAICTLRIEVVDFILPPIDARLGFEAAVSQASAGKRVGG